MVKINFLGPFSRFAPEEDEQGFWQVDGAGKTVEEIMNLTEARNTKMNYSVLVNDVREEKSYILQDHDEVSVLPLFFAG